jgi:hypothetical protein
MEPDRDPAEWPQDRVEQVIQRFEVMRDRADRLLSAAQRIFGPGRTESARRESARKESAPEEAAASASEPPKPPAQPD